MCHKDIHGGNILIRTDGQPPVLYILDWDDPILAPKERDLMFIGGGIAPKILPALKTWGFMEAFLAKEPMRELLEKVPVKVILNPEAGLVGAAVHAQRLI